MFSEILSEDVRHFFFSPSDTLTGETCFARAFRTQMSGLICSKKSEYFCEIFSRTGGADYAS